MSLCLCAPRLAAQTPDTLRDSLARQLARLTREVDALRLELRRQAALLERHDSLAMVQEPAERRAPDQRFGQVSGIASRPFLYRGVNAAIGGYVDLEFARDY
ncbi:MAG: hypothetical protein ACREI7_11340, partial [Myxococcota bacterium]